MVVINTECPFGNKNFKGVLKMTYKEETLKIAEKRAKEIAEKFMEEVKHLLASGGIDSEDHNRGLLFGVALENIADGFLRGERKSKSYKNLKHF